MYARIRLESGGFLAKAMMLGSSTVQNLSEKSNVSAPAPSKPRCALAGPLPHKPLNWTVPALALIALAIIVAYSATLFNWFSGDDFVHLIWLKDAIHNPELIFRNFHANWLDVKTTKFYRPLISVFMVQDYALWGTNGFGFHLTNVLFLIFSSLTLFFIVRDLVAPIQGSRKNTPAFLAALMFGLYPLHLEPVSWITGRVDCIVTAFFLSQPMVLHALERKQIDMAFRRDLDEHGAGLLSKEMAIVLPATFAAYELLAAKRPADAATKDSSPASSIAEAFGKRLLTTAKNTAPFWVTLAGYFIIRRLALGTFVGGYDDAVRSVADQRRLLMTWLHSLSMLFAPGNRDLISSANIYLLIWKLSLVSCAVLAIANCIKDSLLRSRCYFLLAWFAICLAPVYKLFSISDDLQGSRLAYLCTAPLACLIGLAFTKIDLSLRASNRKRARSALALLIYLALPFAAGQLLWKNNSAWAQAGVTSNAVRQELQKFYDKTPGDPQVLIVGLPDNIDGAYVCRNAVDGMTKISATQSRHQKLLANIQRRTDHPVQLFQRITARISGQSAHS